MPKIDGTLLVPRINGSSLFGRPTKSAGNWINPPPPAMASTKPANPDAIAKKIAISILINYLTMVLTTSASATSCLSPDLRSRTSTLPSTNALPTIIIF